MQKKKPKQTAHAYINMKEKKDCFLPQVHNTYKEAQEGNAKDQSHS
jgi:hypothetical protein